MSSGTTNLEVLIQIREELAGLRKTRTELQGAKKDAGALGDAIKSGLGIGTGMQMATAAIGALKSTIIGTLQAGVRLAGEVKDSAEAVGISTSEYQALRIALANAGADASRLQMAIDAQTRSLSEARDSSSAAAKAYAALSLKSEEIERLPVAARLLEVARATATAKDKTEAYAAAAVLLGNRGLGQLLAGLREVAERGLPAAVKMGIAAGEIAPDEAIARADKMGKTFEKLGRQADVAGTSVSAASQALWEVTKERPVSTSFRMLLAGGSPVGNQQFSAYIAQNVKPGGEQQPTIDPEEIRKAQALAAQRAEEAKAAEEARKAEAAHAETIRKLGETTTSSAQTPLERYTATVEALKEQLTAGAISGQTFQRAIVGAQAKLALETQSFRLETEALAAEAAGNTRIAEQKREQIKLLQLTAQMEGQQPALVQARIAAERELTEAQRTRAAQELDFSRRIGELDQTVALIEADNALTEMERRAKILPLLAEQNRLIEQRIALLEKDTRLQQGDQTALDLQKTIDELRKQLADTRGKQVSAAGPETLAMRDAKGLRGMGIGTNADGSPAQIDPSQHYTSVEAGIGGGAANVVAQLGTDGDIAAASIRDNLNSALSDSVSWLDQLAQGAITFQQFWQGAIGYVGDMFRKMAIEMVAKMIWQHTVGRALTAVSVAFHVQGEATKTSSTLSGAAIRIASTIKEALADVYHGAVAAFKALASIPYAGPFLAAAAMAAALAGGIALVNKIGHEKGGYTANVGTGEVAGVVHGKEWVAPAWMLQDNRFGPIIGMLEGARTGSAAAADLLGSDVVGGIAAPVLAMQQAAAPATAGGMSGSGEPLSLHVGVMSKQQQAAEFFASGAGQKVLIDANRATARLYG